MTKKTPYVKINRYPLFCEYPNKNGAQFYGVILIKSIVMRFAVGFTVGLALFGLLGYVFYTAVNL